MGTKKKEVKKEQRKSIELAINLVHCSEGVYKRKSPRQAEELIKKFKYKEKKKKNPKLFMAPKSKLGSRRI